MGFEIQMSNIACHQQKRAKFSNLARFYNKKIKYAVLSTKRYKPKILNYLCSKKSMFVKKMIDIFIVYIKIQKSIIVCKIITFSRFFTHLSPILFLNNLLNFSLS